MDRHTSESGSVQFVVLFDSNNVLLHVNTIARQCRSREPQKRSSSWTRSSTKVGVWGKSISNPKTPVVIAVKQHKKGLCKETYACVRWHALILQTLEQTWSKDFLHKEVLWQKQLSGPSDHGTKAMKAHNNCVFKIVSGHGAKCALSTIHTLRCRWFAIIYT